MDRRTIAGNFFGITLAGGLAAVIAIPALPAGSAYINVLAIGGAAAIIVGLAGLLWLFVLQPRRREEAAPKAVPSVSMDVKTGDVSGSGHHIGHRFGPVARKLNDALRSGLLAIPRDLPVKVHYLQAADDAEDLAREIAGFLQDQGYEVGKSRTAVITSGARRGIVVTKKADHYYLWVGRPEEP